MFDFDDDFGLDDLIELDIQYGLFEEDCVEPPRKTKRKTKHRDKEMEAIIKEIKKLQRTTEKDIKKNIKKIFENFFKSKHEGNYIDYEK